MGSTVESRLEMSQAAICVATQVINSTKIDAIPFSTHPDLGIFGNARSPVVD